MVNEFESKCSAHNNHHGLQCKGLQSQRRPRDSVSSTAVNAQNVFTSNTNDRVDIRAAANNRQGYAEAIGLDSSSLDTGSGNDRVRISSSRQRPRHQCLGRARQLHRYRLR